MSVRVRVGVGEEVAEAQHRFKRIGMTWVGERNHPPRSQNKEQTTKNTDPDAPIWHIYYCLFYSE